MFLTTLLPSVSIKPISDVQLVHFSCCYVHVNNLFFISCCFVSLMTELFFKIQSFVNGLNDNKHRFALGGSLDEHRIVLLSPHTAVEGLDISREHRSPRSALQLCDYYENVFRCSFLA